MAGKTEVKTNQERKLTVDIMVHLPEKCISTESISCFVEYGPEPTIKSNLQNWRRKRVGEHLKAAEAD